MSLLIQIPVFSISDNDAILGKWFNEDKDAVIEIYKQNGKYYGKVTWLKFPLDDNGKPKTDPLNDDESLRDRARMGMVIMYDFNYEGDSEWSDGKIYDPATGNEYSGTMTLVSQNVLDLRGYVGFTWFGRTSTWTRKM